MTTSLPARCPAPVAPLPPRGSRRTGTFSMPITGTFSVPIDTASGQWNQNRLPMRSARTSLIQGNGRKELRL